jgi:hypothetical protein
MNSNLVAKCSHHRGNLVNNNERQKHFGKKNIKRYLEPTKVKEYHVRCQNMIIDAVYDIHTQK